MSNTISEFHSTANMNQNVAGLQPEGAYRVMSKAERLEENGRDVVHLEIGQPDYPTFPNITLAGVKALAEGKTDYNPSRGVRELRVAVANKVSESRGTEVTPEEVVIGPGAKPLLFLTTIALLQEGDRVLYPDPGFPTYRSMIEVAGGEPVPYHFQEKEDGFRIDLNELSNSLTPDTRLLLLNTPGNPLGNVITKGSLKTIGDLLRDTSTAVLSDEIYSEMLYRGYEHETILTRPGMKERTVMVDGFSKTYSMTGWRLGFAVMPKELARKMGYLLTHSVGCTATFTQYAGIEALEGPQGEVKRNMAELEEKRYELVDGLNGIPGVSCPKPKGAFYAFPDVSDFRMDEKELADYLLEEAGAAVLPGTAFGEGGEGYLRLCYASPRSELKKGLKRIEEALSDLERE